MSEKRNNKKIANIALIYAIKNLLKDMGISEKTNDEAILKAYKAKKEQIEKDFGEIDIGEKELIEEVKQIGKNRLESLTEAMCLERDWGRKKSFDKLDSVNGFIKRDKTYIAFADNLLCVVDNSIIPDGSALSFLNKKKEELAKIILKNDNAIKLIPYNDMDPFALLPPYNRIVFDSSGLTSTVGLRGVGGKRELERVIKTLIANAIEGAEILIVASSSLLFSGILTTEPLLNYVERIETIEKGYWPLTGMEIHLVYLRKGRKNQETIEIVVNGMAKRVPYADIVISDNLVPAHILARIDVKKAYSRVRHSIPLEELSEIVPSGEFFVRKRKKDGEEYRYRILRLRDVQGEIRIARLEEKCATQRLGRYILKPWDLVLSVKGDLKRFAIVPEDFPENVILSSNLVALRFKEKEMVELVKIFLESPLGQRIIEAEARGTSIPVISNKALLQIKIPEVVGITHIVKEYNKIIAEYKEQIKNIEQRKKNGIKRIYQKLGIDMELEEIE